MKHLAFLRRKQEENFNTSRMPDAAGEDIIFYFCMNNTENYSTLYDSNRIYSYGQHADQSKIYKRYDHIHGERVIKQMKLQPEEIYF